MLKHYCPRVALLGLPTLLATLLTLLTIPARAEEDPFYRIGVHWQIRKDLLENDQLKLADHRLEMINRERVLFDLANLPDYATALILESREWRDRDRNYALSIAQRALELAPEVPAVYYNASGLLLGSSYFRIFDAMALYARGMFYSYTTLDHLGWIFDVLLRSVLALLATLTILILTLTLKYRACLLNDLTGGANNLVHRLIPLLLTLGFCLMLTLHAGLLGLLLLLAVAVFRYSDRKEKIFLGSLTLIFALLPLSFAKIDTFFNYRDSKYYLAWRANTGNLDPHSLEAFLLQQHGGDPLIAFVQANTLLKLHVFDKAEALYKELLAQEYQSERVMLNLANIYYRTGREAEGTALYDELARSSRNPEVLATLHFNRSRLASKKESITSKEQVERALKEASQQHWKVTDRYSKQVRQFPEKLLFDLPYPLASMQDKLLATKNIPKHRRASSWRLLPAMLSRISPRDLVILSGCALLLMLALVAASLGTIVPYLCGRCGKVAGGQDMLHQGQRMCRSCYEIIILKKPVRERLRIENDRRTKQFHTSYYRGVRLLSLLLPWYYQVISGHLVGPLMGLFGLSLVLTFSLLPRSFEPAFELPNQSMLAEVGLISIAVSLYFWSLIPAFRRR